MHRSALCYVESRVDLIVVLLLCCNRVLPSDGLSKTANTRGPCVECCLPYIDLTLCHAGFQGFTVLMSASKAGHAEVVELLLVAGADMSARDSEVYRSTCNNLHCINTLQTHVVFLSYGFLHNWCRRGDQRFIWLATMAAQVLQRLC